MWERLRSIWMIPDLRKKILFTLVMLLVFRVLAHIPVPLTHAEEQALANLFSSSGNQNLSQLLGLLDVFSGGSLQQFSIVALGVYPYITATIVMQLLMPIIPALENMNREGEAGRLRFSQITRIITVFEDYSGVYPYHCHMLEHEDNEMMRQMQVIPACGSADFDCDGDSGTDFDIEAFFACLAGTCPLPPCASTGDFNADGDVATDADIEAFFRVLAGGSC